MNIFVLSDNPSIAAKHLCDKHVPKMVLETAQLLCSPFEPGVAPYKRTHYNHPCAKWVRESSSNYLWLCAHGFALCYEYNVRFGKIHKSGQVIEWCSKNWKELLDLPNIGSTEWPQCMPDQYKQSNTIYAYRQYYINEKASFAKWDRRKKPYWWRKK